MEEKIMETNLSMENEAENEVVVASVKHYDDMNVAEVEGTLVNRYDLPKITLLTILTNTTKPTRKKKNADDKDDNTSSVTVVVSGKLKEELPEFDKNQRVKIIGEVRTRPITKDGEKSYENVIAASSVEIAKSEMEEVFGLQGRVYGASYNRVTLVGTITRFTQVNRFISKVVLQVKTGEKTRYVEASVYARNMKRLIPQLLVGNRVCMLCEMQSDRKEVDGKAIYRKTLTILDMKEV